MAAIETVEFYRWLWKLLEPIVGKEYLRLADVMTVRALAGGRLKTDREDAFHVAALLAQGRLPLCSAKVLRHGKKVLGLLHTANY